jgi:hypothetical protein
LRSTAFTACWLGFGKNVDFTVENVIIPQAQRSEGNIIELLDDLLRNPKNLGNATPEEWYNLMKENGCNPKPLRKGNVGKEDFARGGGFRVSWGGDKYFQYHPAGRNHHGGEAYYKLSSGSTGRVWLNLLGEPKSTSKEQNYERD